MKYFTYETVSAANDWVEQTEEERRRAEERYWAKVADYRAELESLAPRVSKKAWDFFRYGADEYGLHDGRLLSLTVGDGLDYSPDGRSPFRLNFQRMSARLEFINYEQDFHYSFELRGLSGVRSDLFAEQFAPVKNIGDLYCYELTGVDHETLQLGFLFASGATVLARFRKLLFRRKRVRRSYAVGEMYRRKRGRL